MVKIIAPHGGTIKCDENMEHKVAAAIMTTESVLFDAVFVPGGKKSVDALLKNGKFSKFISEAFKHCKAIAVCNEAEDLLKNSYIKEYNDDKALFVNAKQPQEFVNAMAKHRNWDRMEKASSIPV